MFENQKPVPRLALKIGVAGFIGFGALATGMFVTRKGRRLVGEAWQGKERTTIEDRVLDALWDDPDLARRIIDVDDVGNGCVELIGTVRSEDERETALEIAEGVRGVTEVIDLLEVVARPPRKRLRRQHTDE